MTLFWLLGRWPSEGAAWERPEGKWEGEEVKDDRRKQEEERGMIK